MNKFLISILAVLLMGFWSCSDDELGPFISNLTAPQISAPSGGESFVLEQPKADSSLTLVNWSSADYGFEAAIDYSVQVDVGGNGFSAPQTLGTTIENSMVILTGKLNDAILLLGLDPDVEHGIELRVQSNVNDNVDPLNSNPISMRVTPYLFEIDYPKLHVPGGHNGWDPATERDLVWSPDDNGQYEGYVWFPDENNAFKYTPAPNWDSAYGDNDPNDGSLILGGPSDIFTNGPAGLYKLNANILAETHSFVRTEWGIIGTSTPGQWDFDTDMTYDADAQALTVTMDLTAGVFKFRVNDAWDIDLGDNDNDGTLDYGGTDIPLDDGGNYTIMLHLNKAFYTYTLIKN